MQVVEEDWKEERRIDRYDGADGAVGICPVLVGREASSFVPRQRFSPDGTVLSHVGRLRQSNKVKDRELKDVFAHS